MRELLIFSLFPSVQNYVVGGKNRWEIIRGTLQVIPHSSVHTEKKQRQYRLIYFQLFCMWEIRSCFLLRSRVMILCFQTRGRLFFAEPTKKGLIAAKCVLCVSPSLFAMQRETKKELSITDGSAAGQNYLARLYTKNMQEEIPFNCCMHSCFGAKISSL